MGRGSCINGHTAGDENPPPAAGGAASVLSRPHRGGSNTPSRWAWGGQQCKGMWGSAPTGMGDIITTEVVGVPG